MPKPGGLDMALENFAVNDNRLFDKFPDGATLWVPASCFRMISYHLDTLSNPVLESFGSKWIVLCNATDPLIEIMRGFWSCGHLHGQ
jgi:hypothetical protein